MAIVILSVVAVLYLGVCGLLFATQRRLVFPAPVERAPVQGQGQLVEVPRGTLMLWREVAGQGPVIVHFHGNGEQVAWLGELAERFAEQGLSFAAVEYPGYPGAPGAPSEESLVAAGEAALTHLTSTLHVARERLVLQGQSLGSGVAVALAAKGWGTRLVLLTPYTSLPDVGARAFPWLPVRWLMRDRFDSAAKAPGLQVPVLVVHGTSDEVVPFELGQTLAARFPHGRFVQVSGAHHNDVWDRQETRAAVWGFLRPP